MVEKHLQLGFYLALNDTPASAQCEGEGFSNITILAIFLSDESFHNQYAPDMPHESSRTIAIPVAFLLDNVRAARVVLNSIEAMYAGANLRKQVRT